LVNEYNLHIVKSYMTHIQNCAENAVRSMLKDFVQRMGTNIVQAQDYLDDGTVLCLKISIDATKGSAVFDFTGTGAEVYGNLNAPPAVTYSAAIYCLRCLLPPTADIPLNQGCLTPVEIIIPKGTVLNPSNGAAVVGGNVLTSQRVTDLILLAFDACAASQGCMNNFTFGDSSMGYYETIAGGAGAGPTWRGCSGVHTHMTNTRITDPEILERRFPVYLRRFELRQNSGGAGANPGGDGIIREIEFGKDLTMSILSERRSIAPYGMHGGKVGAKGMNLLHIYSSGSDEKQGEGRSSYYRTVNLGGKNTVEVKKRDRIEIRTPGGGGWGLGVSGPCVGSSVSTVSASGEAVTGGGLIAAGSLHAWTQAQESA
jgi:5-oxoprolinase (ATP-hydrolysing)